MTTAARILLSCVLLGGCTVYGSCKISPGSTAAEQEGLAVWHGETVRTAVKNTLLQPEVKLTCPF